MNETIEMERNTRRILAPEDLNSLISEGNAQSRWLSNWVIIRYMEKILPTINRNVMIIDSSIWGDLVQNSTVLRNERIYRNFVIPTFNEAWSYIMFPIHEDNNHWTLVAVDRSGRADYYDSFGYNLTEDRKKVIRKWIRGVGINIEIEFNNVREIYRQRDSFSCGAAICMFAERILMNESLEFTQEEVKTWRNDAYQILSADLNS
jgi:hypothetical protein